MLTMGENYIVLRVLHHKHSSGMQECKTSCNVSESVRQIMSITRHSIKEIAIYLGNTGEIGLICIL